VMFPSFAELAEFHGNHFLDRSASA